MVKRLFGIGAVLIAALGLALGVVALLLEGHQVRGLVAAVPGLESQADAVAAARNDLAAGVSATVDEITFDVSKTVRGLLGQRPDRPRVLIELPPELRTPAPPDAAETAELPPAPAEPPATQSAMPAKGAGAAEPTATDMPTAAEPMPSTGTTALSQAYERPPPPPMTPEQMRPPTMAEKPMAEAPAEPAEPAMPPEAPEAPAPAAKAAPAEPPEHAAAPEKPAEVAQPTTETQETPPAAAGKDEMPPETETTSRTPDAVPGRPGAAEHRLAVRYYKGDRVLQDYPKAADLFRRAAMQGHAAAQYNLGIMNYFGQGVPPDIAEASHWFKRAAEQDFADAQYNLGFLYYEGLGVEKDPAKAWLWFSRAAEHGHAEATKVREQLKAELPPEITRQ